MNNPGLRKSFLAGGDIAAYRIVKFGADDDHVVQAAAATDMMIGVNDSIAPNSGERTDIVLTDVAEVEYGGTVTRGQLLTSDADGKAITQSAATGVNNRVIGVAMESGVAGDIGSVLISPTEIQGE